LQKSHFIFIMSVCHPVRPYAWNNTATNGQIFMKTDICVFLEKRPRKLKFY
jgi:hypothetical protein